MKEPLREIIDVTLPDEIRKLNGKSARRLKKCATDLDEAIEKRRHPKDCKCQKCKEKRSKES